jgi:Domain of unknown function (DUF4417)
VLRSGELRETIGLTPQQQLVLLLFDSDPVLERLWDEAVHLLPEIAGAEYDAVVAPSYSIWLPRPRTEFLYNVKRSLIVFQALQQMNVPVVPRIAWVIEHDVRRWAEWVSGTVLEVVALDLMTFRARDDWRRQVEGLALFDRLTHRRLRYLINGPTTVDRCADVYAAVAPRRVSITNATLAAPFSDPDETQPAQLRMALNGDYAAGRKMAARCASQRSTLTLARRLSRTRPRKATRSAALGRPSRSR